MSESTALKTDVSVPSSRRAESVEPPSEALRSCLLGLLAASPGLVMIATTEGRLLYMNLAGRSMLRVGLDTSVAARRLDEFYAARAYRLLLEHVVPQCIRTGAWHGEITLRAADGQEVPVTQVFVRRSIELNGRDVTVFASIAWDMSRYKLTEQALRRQATHDALTDCPNRVLLMDRLTQAIRRAARQRRHVGVLFLDIDDFKQVNDVFGHESANAVLCELSQRMRARLRATDTVARYGGDEFVLVIPELNTPAHLSAVTAKVRQALREPFLVEGRTIHVEASIGSALFPRDGATVGELLRKADADMYRSKKGEIDISSVPSELSTHLAALTRPTSDSVLRAT
jgi:diguanylate cyclase (GGDEF)-like protein